LDPSTRHLLRLRGYRRGQESEACSHEAEGTCSLMVGRAAGRQAFQRKTEDQKLGSDDRQAEGEVHSERLPDHSVQAHAEPETEVDVGERIHRRIL
jgi:hypothetical protein